MGQKCAPFYFCNNFVKLCSVLVIFGTQIPKWICNIMQYKCPPFTVNAITLSSSILDYERCARSWFRFLGSQPAGDLVTIPVVGCRYFPPGSRSRGYFSSQRDHPLGRYQITLIGDRGTRVQVACPRPLRNGALPGLEPAICESQVRYPANTETAHYLAKCSMCQSV